MWDSSHTHTYHTINQIGVSQSPPLKSLTSLGPTLWGSVFEPTLDYRAGFDTICNNLRKSASHICTLPQKDLSQLRLFAVINKAQFNPVNTWCRTYHTPTHITQSIKLGRHNEFDWLCDVCGCVMSPTSGIYWVELGFINNCKEAQLWLVLLRYSAGVASAFPWVVTRALLFSRFF